MAPAARSARGAAVAGRFRAILMSRRQMNEGSVGNSLTMHDHDRGEERLGQGTAKICANVASPHCFGGGTNDGKRLFNYSVWSDGTPYTGAPTRRCGSGKIEMGRDVGAPPTNLRWTRLSLGADYNGNRDPRLLQSERRSIPVSAE